MVLVKPATVEIHLRICDPWFGNQHHHRVRQRAAPHHEEFERVVETGGIALILVNDREQLLHILVEQVGVQPTLAGPHPVDVALQGVDLAVVTDKPVRMSQRPRGECVGAEPRVDERERTGHAGIGQVLVVSAHLMRQQQTFIDHGVARQARNVKIVAAFDCRFTDGLLDLLADHVQLAFELLIVEDPARDKDLPHERLGLAGLHADGVALDGHVAPTEQLRAFFLHNAGEQGLALLARVGVGRHEQHAHAVLSGIGQLDADILRRTLEKFMRHLQQNT